MKRKHAPIAFTLVFPSLFYTLELDSLVNIKRLDECSSYFHASFHVLRTITLIVSYLMTSRFVPSLSIQIYHVLNFPGTRWYTLSTFTRSPVEGNAKRSILVLQIRENETSQSSSGYFQFKTVMDCLKLSLASAVQSRYLHLAWSWKQCFDWRSRLVSDL